MLESKRRLIFMTRQSKITTSLLMLLVIFSMTSVQAALDDSVVLYLPFDEGSGNAVADSSSYGNDAVVNGGEWVSGKYGGGMEFGAEKFLEIADNDSLDLTTTLSISMWVKIAAGGEATQSGLEKQPAWQAGEYNLAAVYGGGVLLQAADLPADCADTAVTPEGIEDDNWHHIAGTWDGTIIKVYIDGAEKASEDCVGEIKVGDGNVYVGSRGGTGRWVNGALDEIKVFNRALSADEVKADMEKTATTAVDAKSKLAISWGEIKSAK